MDHTPSVRTKLAVTATLLATTVYLLVVQFLPSPRHLSSPGYHWDQSVRERWGNTSSNAKMPGHTTFRTKTGDNTTPPPFMPISLMYVANRSFQGRNVSRGNVREHKTVAVLNAPVWFNTRRTSSFNFIGCDVDACVLTTNESELEKADAVLINLCSGTLPTPLPFQPAQDQVWITMGQEAPPYCHYYRNPYSRNFNWTWNYRTDADIFAPYAVLSLRQSPAEKNYTAIISGKSKPVAWFVSNCGDRSKRLEYTKELGKHIQVDVYGRCGSFTCPRSKENDCRRLLNTTYFFYLSFENSLCRDYMTEKVFKLYDNVDVIPVVRGLVDYDRYLPPGTFINTADFPTPRALALRLTALMAADTQAYAEMLRLKDRFSKGSGGKSSFCQICQKLHEDSGTKTYPNLEKWASQGICQDAGDVHVSRGSFHDRP